MIDGVVYSLEKNVSGKGIMNDSLPHGSKVAKRPSALKTLTLQAAGAGISLLNSTPSKPNANI